MPKIIIFLGLVVFFFFSASVSAKVVINEFLIDSSPQQVELFNTGDQPTDISNWYLDDAGGTTFFTIPSTLLYPHACVVFSSDLNLNKSTPDSIRLFDNTAPPTSSSAVLLDNFSYKSSPGSQISYLRQPDGADIWASGSATLGLFNSSSVSCIVTPTPTPTLSPTPNVITDSPTLPVTPTPPIYENIYISEVMTYPETGDHEWVELFNDNDFDVNLENWYIDDLVDAGSSPKLFSIIISRKGYNVIDLTSSMFNNGGDSVRLLNQNREEKDSFEYFKSEQGKTLGRVSLDSDFFCIQESSKNTNNNECINITPTVVPNISLKTTAIPLSHSPTISTTSSVKPYTPIPQLTLVQNNVGSVLGSQDELETATTDQQNQSTTFSPYIKGLSASSIIISLMNIGMIAWKIIQKEMIYN